MDECNCQCEYIKEPQYLCISPRCDTASILQYLKKIIDEFDLNKAKKTIKYILLHEDSVDSRLTYAFNDFNIPYKIDDLRKYGYGEEWIEGKTKYFLHCSYSFIEDRDNKVKKYFKGIHF